MIKFFSIITILLLYFVNFNADKHDKFVVISINKYICSPCEVKLIDYIEQKQLDKFNLICLYSLDTLYNTEYQKYIAKKKYYFCDSIIFYKEGEKISSKTLYSFNIDKVNMGFYNEPSPSILLTNDVGNKYFDPYQLTTNRGVSLDFIDYFEKFIQD